MATIGSDVVAVLAAAFPILATSAPVALGLWTYLRGGMMSEETFENREKLILETLVERLYERQRDAACATITYTWKTPTIEFDRTDFPPETGTKLGQEIVRTIRTIARVTLIGRRLRTLHTICISNTVVVFGSMAAGAFFPSTRPVASSFILLCVVSQVVVAANSRHLSAELSIENGRA